jgi:YHS domain-containing protein
MTKHIAIALLLGLAALGGLTLASAQCGGCPSAGGCGGMKSAGASGLAGLKLPNLAGDTVDLSQHIGMMPVAVLLAGTDSASADAADVFAAAQSSAGESGPMFVTVVGAGPKTSKAFAKAHKLTGMVLVDAGKTAMTSIMADKLPLVLFYDQTGAIVHAGAKVTEQTVAKGLKKMSESTQAVDPVCGMTVSKSAAAATYVYQGQTYYFCSKACHDNFVKDPGKYLAR